MDWIEEILKNLLEAEFPCQLGEVYFGTREAAQFQIDAWRMYVNGENPKFIASVFGITSAAARKRVDKIRDYLCQAIVGNTGRRKFRIKAVVILMEEGLLKSQATRIMGMG